MEQIQTDSICENLCHLWMIFVVTGVRRSWMLLREYLSPLKKGQFHRGGAEGAEFRGQTQERTSAKLRVHRVSTVRL